MRLVKLLAYSMLGYVIYELYLGMTEGAAQGPSRSSGSGRADADVAPTPRVRAKKSVAVEDADGARTSRTVGRGVVH